MTARADAALRALAVRNQVIVRSLDDRTALKRELSQTAPYAAYALAYLDPRLFSLARFYEAQRQDRRAIVMHARGGLGPSTMLFGDASLLSSLLKLHPGSRQTLLTCEPDHVDTALATHNLFRPQSMLRMQVDRASFTGREVASDVRRLIGADARDLNRLYALEGDGIWYSPNQVASGIYYGALNRGRLVAAAGTHIYSGYEGVAVVGNVFTHPDYRGHGYGTAVTAAVTEQLLRICNLVVLNVDPANRVARHIYEALGYREAGRLVEAMSTLRYPYSPLPLMRRLIARLRSRSAGIEVVDPD
jgi:RimJ/RimL family protein N-acetyltransferase